MTRTAATPIRASIAAALLATCASLALAQTLTIGVRGGPDSIDPHFTATGTHAETLKHVFDTLVWSGDGLEIEPRLAESWKAIDPTTWEFKLRARREVPRRLGLHRRGREVLDRAHADVDGPEPDHDLCAPREGSEDRRSAHVHVVTDGPAPNLPNDFIRLFIVSHKAAAGVTKENANEAFNSGKAAVGTGPYKFVSWTPKGDFVVDRFDGYWGGKEPWARHRAQGDPERRRARRAAQGRPARPDHARAGLRRRDARARSEDLGRQDRHRLCVQPRNGHARQAAGRADHRQGRLGAAEESATTTCACARRSISPSTARRWPRSRWKVSASR